MATSTRVRFGLRALVCAASLGLALGCATAVPAAFADEAPEFGTGTVIEDDFAPDSMPADYVGSWTIENLEAIGEGAEETNAYFETLMDAGMNVTLEVDADYTFVLTIAYGEDVNSVEGSWSEEEDLTGYFGVDGDGYEAVMSADGTQLVLTSADETMTFARVGEWGGAAEAGQTALFGAGGAAPAGAAAERSDVVRYWELSGLAIGDQIGLPGEVQGIVMNLTGMALNFLGDNMGVSGSVTVNDDGTFLLVVTGGSLTSGRNLVYQGTWQEADDGMIVFMNPEGDADAVMVGSIADGQMRLHLDSGSIPQLGAVGAIGDLVFVPVHEVPAAQEAVAADVAVPAEGAAEEAVEEAAEEVVEEAQLSPDEIMAAAVSESVVVGLMPYNAGTGYSWTCEVADPGILALYGTETVDESGDPEMTGGPLTDIFALIPIGYGETTATFTLARPWEASADDITCVFGVAVAEDGTVTVTPVDVPEGYEGSVVVY